MGRMIATRVALSIFMIVIACGTAIAQEDYEVIRAFGRDGGSQPWSGLMKASDGNFYGSSVSGLYRLTPGGVYSPLANLGGFAFLPVQASDGNLYTATNSQIFRVALDGTATVLHTITNTFFEGLFTGGLVEGPDGLLYGVTYLNGAFELGTLYRISPDGTYTTLRSLTPSDGLASSLRLMTGSDGAIYGTTRTGGIAGAGTVFRLADDGAAEVIRTFTGGLDGGDLLGGIVEGRDGNFYGTTRVGGAHGAGTFFRLARDGAFGVLYNFRGLAPGGDAIVNVHAPLVEGSDGHFYGATEDAIFRLTLDGTARRLHDARHGSPGWAGSARWGWSPMGLIEGPDGDLYGAVRYGAPGNNGGLFRLKRNRSACTNTYGLGWYALGDGSGRGDVVAFGALKSETPAVRMAWLVSAQGVLPLFPRAMPTIDPALAYETAFPYHGGGAIGIFSLVVTSTLAVCPAWAVIDTGGIGATSEELRRVIPETRLP